MKNRLLRLAKELVKRLPYPLFLRTYDFWDRIKFQRTSEAYRRQLGVPLLDESHIKDLKHGDTLFLLGSGPSVNDISAQRWEVIGQHDSWGFNFWPYHPFVPDLYFFEAVPREEWSHIYNAYVKLTHEHGKRYEHVPKVISEIHNEDAKRMFDEISPEWKKNVYAIVATRPSARTAKQFRVALRYLLRKGVFGARWPWGNAFKYGSTLSMLIGLAVRMGYKRIVLCGIDLRSQEYFYQDPRLFPQYAALVPEPAHLKHLTFRDLDWLVNIDEVLSALSDIILRPRGISLFVENRSSALWPAVPELDQDFYGASASRQDPRAGAHPSP